MPEDENIVNPYRWVRHRQWILPLLIVLAGVVAYANSFGGAFVFDDILRIRVSLGVRSISEALLGSTRPLVGVTLFLNHLVGGLNPAEFHLVNLLIHLAAGLTLYGVLRRTLAGLRGLTDSASFLAAAAAAVWVVHPVQTESVTYIIQRAESLMGFFYLLTLYGFIRALNSPRPDRWYTASIVFCALGMASKPVMVTAPVVVLCYDRTFAAGSFSEAVRARKGYYAGLGATWLILVALLSVPNESSSSAGFGAGVVSPTTYLLTQPEIVWHYLRLAVWPRGLCLDYGWPPLERAWDALVPAIGILLVVGACAWAFWRRKPLGFAGLWFFLILAPTSSFIPVADFCVEHRLYLSLAGLAAPAVAGIHRLLERGRPRHRFWCELLLFSVWVAVLCVWTRDRNRDYASVESMSRATLARRPDNFRAHTSLISRLIDETRFQEAEREARIALKRLEAAKREGGSRYSVSATSPWFFIPVVKDQLGRALLCQGKAGEALVYLADAVEADPDSRGVCHNYALALYLSGQKEQALQEARSCVRRHPGHGEARGLLGYLLAEQGDATGALAHFRAAVRRAPYFHFARCELAWLLATHPQSSLRDGREAIATILPVCEASNWLSVRALDILAAGYAEVGDFEAAVATVERAIALAETRGAAHADPDLAPGTGKPSAHDLNALRHRARLYRRKEPFRSLPAAASAP